MVYIWRKSIKELSSNTAFKNVMKNMLLYILYIHLFLFFSIQFLMYHASSCSLSFLCHLCC